MCCCQGYGPRCGAMVHLRMCAYICVCTCICAFVCTRMRFMINKQLFSARFFQLFIKSLVVKLHWESGGWTSAHQPTLVDVGLVSHSGLLRKAKCLLHLTTVPPSENGPTSNEESKINSSECSLWPRVLLSIRALAISAANSSVITRGGWDPSPISSHSLPLFFPPTNENNGYECFWCTLIVTSTVFIAVVMV